MRAPTRPLGSVNKSVRNLAAFLEGLVALRIIHAHAPHAHAQGVKLLLPGRELTAFKGQPGVSSLG